MWSEPETTIGGSVRNQERNSQYIKVLGIVYSILIHYYSCPPNLGNLTLGVTGEGRAAGTPNGNLPNRLLKGIFKSHQYSVENQEEKDE